MPNWITDILYFISHSDLAQIVLVLFSALCVIGWFCRDKAREIKNDFWGEDNEV